MRTFTTTILSALLCFNFLAQCNYGNDQPLSETSAHIQDYLLGTAIHVDYPVNISKLGMICMDENDNFEVAIYNDNNGVPGSLLTSGSGVTQLGEVIVDVPDVIVSPGTYYFMVVFESNSSISCDSVANESIWYVPQTYGEALPSNLSNTILYTGKKFAYFLVCDPDASLHCVNTTIYANNANADSYQWMECSTGNIIPGANGNSFTGALFDSYYCIVSQNGCSRISECFTIGVTGLEDPTLNEKAAVSPNPSNGQFNVQLPNTTDRFDLMLYDLNGKEVMRRTTSGKLSLELNEDLLSGFYLLHIVSGQHHITERIIIN